MSLVTRISLPGYDALKDTNLDHFSLYADTDNILIKRKQTGTATLASSSGSPTVLTIPHNLGYIPFFMVYIDSLSNGKWQILNNRYDNFSVPPQLAAVDTTNLYIYNFEATTRSVAYDIFYDQMAGGSAPAIKESNQVFKVTRPGYDALVETNPNNYIMHSDLNNFKILKEGIANIDCNGLTTVTIPHGANVQAPFKYFLFIKSPFDNETVVCGGTADTNVFFDNESTKWFGSSMDATNIYVTKNLANFTEVFNFKYYIYGSGKNGTVPTTGNELAVSAPGKNVLTETNPDNFNFHSDFNTLKYYISNTYTMSVSTSTTHTIPHNLGYVPFFMVFVNDLKNFIPGGYAICPYYLGRSSFGGTHNNDIGAFAFADATNIYVKAWFDTNAVGTLVNFTFYYKIFKNNLGL